ncbi:hypothetical protein CLV98_10784 [Dyadobacter jejuensis]|uniref:Uncharacterized protein n=2 Tax=Dyadobacter jejuensis TaxID=1082580 RepID=A0A316B468_9BACT|nr:hypothetical protein CLV98_10784 [Dyadobacter jejuensis]
MKNLRISGIALVLVVLSLSCKEKKTELPGVPDFVPKEIIDDFRSKGLIINEGVTPPMLEGYYLASPLTLLVPFGPDDPYQAGKLFSDYRYSFYDQTDDNQIKYDFKSANGSATGTGTGSFISGEGNKFTLYSEQIGETYGIENKQITIISGELDSDGIKNWQEAFVFTYKGDDPNGQLIQVGQGRIIYDSDHISERVSSLRLDLSAGDPSESDALIGSQK